MSDDFFDIGWEEMALAGALSTEMADEERLRLKRLLEGEVDTECDCCCAEDEPFDPPDEEPYP
jgi:hypothetical protein